MRNHSDADEFSGIVIRRIAHRQLVERSAYLRPPLPAKGGSKRAAEAEDVGLLAHRGDAKRDVIIERNAEFFSALDHVFAADGASKGLVFHPLFHRSGFKIKNALRWAHVRACRKEAGKLRSE